MTPIEINVIRLALDTEVDHKDYAEHNLAAKLILNAYEVEGQSKTYPGVEVKIIIGLYEELLHGEDNKLGLLDCCDSYYAGCWVEQLKRVEEYKLLLNKLTGE